MISDILDSYSAFAYEPANVAIELYVLPGGTTHYRFEDKARHLTISYGASLIEALEKANVDVEYDFDAQAIIDIDRMPHTWGIEFGRCRNGQVFARANILPYIGSTSPCYSHTEYRDTFSAAIRGLRWNIDLVQNDLRLERWLERMRADGHGVHLYRTQKECLRYRVEVVTNTGRRYRSTGNDPYSALVMFGIYVSDNAERFFEDSNEDRA